MAGIVYKSVETQGEYELVSFVSKDLTHYSIRKKGTTEIFETVPPTKTLNGWALRKTMSEKLKKYSSGEAVEVNSFKGTSSLTTNIRDLEVGMILTYQVPGPLGNQRFYKVTALGEWLVSCVDPNGASMFWSYESLDNLLVKGKMKVMPTARIPESLTFPEEVK